jgi:hypothetical protein
MPGTSIPEGMAPIDASFFRLGNVSTLTMFDGVGMFHSDADFTWLLPGGADGHNLPYYFPPAHSGSP